MIELVVVFAIIGIIATLIMVNVFETRKKAKIAKAQGDISQIKTAIEMLANETGLWPGHQVIGGTAPIAPNEICENGCDQGKLTEGIAGIKVADAGFENWSGPYMEYIPLDPWGRSYIFDPEYTPYQNCSSIETQSPTAVVMSPGPTIDSDYGINDFDCDDIFIKLK